LQRSARKREVGKGKKAALRGTSNTMIGRRNWSEQQMGSDKTFEEKKRRLGPEK